LQKGYPNNTFLHQVKEFRFIFCLHFPNDENIVGLESLDSFLVCALQMENIVGVESFRKLHARGRPCLFFDKTNILISQRYQLHPTSVPQDVQRRGCTHPRKIKKEEEE
jgi:hypothetical protein